MYCLVCLSHYLAGFFCLFLSLLVLARWRFFLANGWRERNHTIWLNRWLKLQLLFSLNNVTFFPLNWDKLELEILSQSKKVATALRNPKSIRGNSEIHTFRVWPRTTHYCIGLISWIREMKMCARITITIICWQQIQNSLKRKPHRLWKRTWALLFSLNAIHSR